VNTERTAGQGKELLKAQGRDQLGAPPPSPTVGHSFVVSDIHLSDAQPMDPSRPLWKRFKGRDLFVDRCFGRFLEHAESLSEGPAELILDGDTFDFDSVMDLPERPGFSVR